MLLGRQVCDLRKRERVPGLFPELPLRGLVFQNADARLDYGSPWAFGRDGVGGSIGFADPAYDLAFGYVTSRMPVPGGADQHGIALARTIRPFLRNLRR